MSNSIRPGWAHDARGRLTGTFHGRTWEVVRSPYVPVDEADTPPAQFVTPCVTWYRADGGEWVCSATRGTLGVLLAIEAGGTALRGPYTVTS